MIDGRQKTPRRSAGVDSVVVERLRRETSFDESGESVALEDGRIRKLVDRIGPREQMKARFFDECNAALPCLSELDESHGLPQRVNAASLVAFCGLFIQHNLLTAIASELYWSFVI